MHFSSLDDGDGDDDDNDDDDDDDDDTRNEELSHGGLCINLSCDHVDEWELRAYFKKNLPLVYSGFDISPKKNRNI